MGAHAGVGVRYGIAMGPTARTMPNDAGPDDAVRADRAGVVVVLLTGASVPASPTALVGSSAMAQELSQDAYDRLTAELEDLRTRGRIEMADRIERAREHGDLKENAEYHAAKEEKAKMEARVAQLFGILEGAVIVEIGGASDEVRIGTIVTLRYDGDDEDEVEKYLVGSIEEASDGVTVISPTSALGEALLGAKAGDSVTYSAPNGELTVIVVEIH